MNDIQLAHFSWGETPDRSRIHAIAMRDARIATEVRMAPAATSPRPSLAERVGLARLRIALTGGSVAKTDACACAA